MYRFNKNLLKRATVQNAITFSYDTHKFKWIFFVETLKFFFWTNFTKRRDILNLVFLWILLAFYEVLINC